MEVVIVRVKGERFIANKTGENSAKLICRLSDVPGIMEENRHLKLENDALNAQINNINEYI